MSIVLFSYILSISASSLSFIAKPTLLSAFYYYSYAAVVAITAFETLLLTELTTQLYKKFSILNAKICPEIQTRDNVTKERIMRIMITHHHLSAISRKLNKIFGFPVLVTTAVNFQIATTGLYYTLQLLSLPPTLTSVIQLTNALLWSIVMLVQLCIISSGFENISREVSYLKL